MNPGRWEETTILSIKKNLFSYENNSNNKIDLKNSTIKRKTNIMQNIYIKKKKNLTLTLLRVKLSREKKNKFIQYVN
jgi:hypothetical protein